MASDISLPVTRSPLTTQWVFSPGKDFVIFYGTLLLAAALSWAYVGQARAFTTSYLFFAILFFDGAHTFGSYVAAIGDKKISARLGWKKWGFPLLLLCTLPALYFLSQRYFEALVIYFNLYHISAQQYGWLRLIQRRQGSAKFFFHWLDVVTLVSSMLVPILFWHTGQSAVPQIFFQLRPFLFHFPLNLWTIVAALHWAINLVYVAKTLYVYWRYKENELGKSLLLLSTWIWYYGGLVLSPSPIFFFICITFCHAGSYHYFLNSYWNGSSKNFDPAGWLKKRNFQSVGKYTLLIGLSYFAYLGSIWALFKSSGLLLPIFWCGQLAHYGLDGIMWKSEKASVAKMGGDS